METTKKILKKLNDGEFVTVYGRFVDATIHKEGNYYRVDWRPFNGSSRWIRENELIDLISDLRDSLLTKPYRRGEL